MRPRGSLVTGGFDVSGCGDSTCCPPFKQADVSNNEPSTIALQRIPCMCGLYTKFHPPSQHALPVRNIDPLIELESDLPKVSDLLEPEFFMQGDAGVIW